MVLIENFTRLVMGDEPSDWYKNWKLLAEKDPTEAENSIKKFVKKHKKDPSPSDLLVILGIEMD
jgi:hypothetical protein